MSLDGVPVTLGVLESAMDDDGARLGPLPLARVLGRPRAGADGRRQGEPSLFHDGDLVGTVAAVHVMGRRPPDCGAPGESSIAKESVVGGQAAGGKLGLFGDTQSDTAHHGGADKALYVMNLAEQQHGAGLLPGLAPGRLGETLLIAPAALGGIDDVEIGAVLSIGDSQADGVRVRVTGVHDPCLTFARGVGWADWADVFSARNRVGVYFAVVTEGSVREGDEVRLLTSPGHRVTCTRWLAYHAPRDVQAMLSSEAFGNCVIAPYTKRYFQAAAREALGEPAAAGPAS